MTTRIKVNHVNQYLKLLKKLFTDKDHRFKSYNNISIGDLLDMYNVYLIYRIEGNTIEGSIYLSIH